MIAIGDRASTPALRKAEWDRMPLSWREKTARERIEYWESLK